MSKQKRAVMVGLEKTSQGTMKICLDDLIESSNDPKNWNKDVLYTFKEYDIKTFEELDFSEKELADFGYSIIARLFAFYEQGEI